MKNYYSKLLLLLGTFALGNNVWAQTTIIDPTVAGAFEGASFTADGWTTANNATTNQWVQSTGATAGFTGTKCAYITNNAAGSPPPHAYTNSASRVSALYRDVTVPAGETTILLSFRWINLGESGYDRLQVWAVPTSFIPPNVATGITTTGSAPTGRVLLGTGTTGYVNSATWGTANITIPAAYAGTSFRLVFQWRNDGSGGSNPPIAIDDVSLTSSCSGATTAAVSPYTLTTATLNAATFAGATGYNFRYREVGSPTWTNAPGNPYATPSAPITGLTANTSYEFQVSAAGPVCNTWSASANFFTGYCLVSTTNTSDYTSAFSTTGALANVSYTASSQPAGSYSNQTAQSYQATAGTTINFLHTFVGGSNGVNIWVDWNDNLVFDAGENVYYLANTSATKTGSFTIPGGTAVGNYRMRVRSQWGSTANPPSCGNVAFGSTVDYNLQVVTPPSCISPTAPTATPTSTSSADVSWTAASPAPSVGYIYSVTTSATPPADGAGTPTTGTSASVTGLSANTTYYLHVQSDCGGSSYSLWATASFFTGYCLVSTTNTSDYTSAFSTTGALANVSYTASSQPSGSYSNQTAQSFQATAGATINFSHTFVGGSNGVNIWVDWNNNLVFDAGENVFYLANTSATKTGSFTIPGGTAVGNYRMRVRSEWGSTANPPSCGNVAFGSTVDYNLQVVAPPSCLPPSALGAGNFSGGSADLTWTCSGCTGTYEIEYGAQGFTQGTGTTVTSASSPRNITGLTVGSSYGFYVRQDCGVNGFSTWIGPFNFRVPSPGEVCGAPIVISSLPYSTTDNTSNYGDDYNAVDRPALTGAQVANGTGAGDYLTGDDVVYSFTPAASGCYNINLTNPSDWVALFLFQGCAPFTSTVGYHTSTSGASRSLPNLNLTAGTTYYIVISSWTAPQSIAYTLTVEACPTCPQPTVLGSNTVLSTTANLTWTSNASSSLFDIYYGPTPLTAPTGATTPTVDDYNGGAGASITYGATGLSANTAYQYYVREDCGGGDVSTWSGPHSFTTPPPPPANDNCAGAIAFPAIPTTGDCANVTVNTAGATGVADATCTGTEDDDVWYTFTVPAGNTTVNYSTTNITGSTDRAFQVYNACAGTSIFCSDNESGSITGLVAGQTYILRTYTWSSGVVSNFSLCLSVTPPPPANDNCAGARPLISCGAADTTINLGGATQSIAAISCGGFTGTANDDVWYSFVADATTMYITVKGFGGYDAVVDLRTGGCNGTNIACADASGVDGFEDIIATALTVGQTYLVRVYDWFSTTPNASFGFWIQVGPSGCWQGANSSAWNDGGNWSNGVAPNSCAANIIIPSGTPFAPAITTGSFTVGNVNIASGVNLTLTGNNLNVCGNWAAGTGANAVTVGSGNVVLQGTAAQTISGNTNFERLTVNATGSYTNNGTVTISQRYTPQAGSLNNAGTMTFLSTSPSDIATIDLNPANTGSLTGNITAQRFIPTGGSNQHYVSSPLNSLPLSQFGASGGSGNVVPTANCDETQLAVGSLYGTVFRYNEANGSACSLAGWEVVSSGSAENARGYSAYLTGAGTPLSVNGVANMGSTYTKTGNTNSNWTNTTLQGRSQNSGWALVGNPYLSTINLSDKTGAGFDNQAQVWQTSGPYTGTYQPVVMGSGSAFVAPFQGFMVRKTAVGGTADFTVGRSECVNNTSTFYKTSSNGTVSIVVHGNGFADVTKVVFDENSTNQFDNTMDANKLPGRLAQPMLASKLGSDLYSINNLNSIATNPTVPLEFMPGTNGSYTFTFDDISTFNPTVMVYLEDKMSQNGWYDLRARNVQTFTCSTTDRKDRFVLHFTAPVQSDSKDADCDDLGTIALEEIATSNWNVTISNTQGTIVHTQVLDKNNPVNVKNLVPGTYDITFTTKSGYVATRQITISGVQPLVANISASTLTPNVNQSVQFNSSLNTAATVSWDFGDGNTSAIENPTHVYAAEGIYKVVLIAVSNDGCTNSTTQNVNVRSVATGIENNSNSQEVIVNNIGNNVVVSFKGYTNENASIIISNVLGQVLFTGNHNVSSTFNYTLQDVDTQVLIIKTTIDGKSIKNLLALTSK